MLIKLALKAVKWGLVILRDSIVRKLPEGQNKLDVQTLFIRFEDLITRLTNDNPDNNAELTELLRTVIGVDLLISLRVRRDSLVEQVSTQDARLGKTINLFSQPVLDIPTYFTDEVVDNLQQIKDRFAEFARNSDVHDLVLYDWIEPTLIDKGVNPTIVAIILRTIADAILGKIGLNGRKLKSPTVSEVDTSTQEVVDYLYSRADALSGK